MPHSSSKIPSAIFYMFTFSEFNWIARHTIGTNDFTPRASDLLSRTAQRGNRATQN